MAFPSAGTPVDTDFATSVTSMAVNMPATVDAGDLLIAIVSVRNALTWNTIPTGWNKISESAGGGSVGELSIFYKIADGSEDGGTATWVASVGSSAAWMVIRVTGWHGTTPPEVGTAASGDASNANPPSVAPSWGSDDNLFIAVAGNAATGETTGFTAAPTNYGSLRNNGASSGGATCNVASATRQLAAASDDPGTFTPNSNRFWAAQTIAIRPAAAAGGDPTPLRMLMGMGS